MKKISVFVAVFVFLVVFLEFTDAWKGNFQKVRKSRRYWVSYCTCWYRWWGCSFWRGYWRTTYYTQYMCQPGWSHNGDQNCIIPICRPSCQNGGSCTLPNQCTCPSWSQGEGCASLTCSYRRPCYPGNCTGGTDCTCEPGFRSQNVDDGCIIFDSTREELRPNVGRSNVTLSHIRRTDDKVDFMFILEGLEEEKPGQLEIIWSNQKRFNNLRFEYETFFDPPEGLPKRPKYVHESEIGIVESIIEANVSKVARNKGPIRDEGSFKAYKCEGGFSKDNPETELATCIIDDDQFKTLIEHGDWLNVKFKSSSGGFQQLVNIDDQSKNYARKHYVGLQDIREVQFNFDFIAPKHCTEIQPCTSSDPSILRIKNEFTKDPIEMYWSGWTDELSGIWEYYVEVFKLAPNIYNNLVEAEPLKPVYSVTIPHNRGNISYPTFRPKEPGMYSVLVETRDIANNSRIARRLVLFDDKSDITLNTRPDGKLYVSSAVAETGYRWQTSDLNDDTDDIEIDVDWSNHFINTIIEDNKLLYPVDPYPTQFKEIQDDGVLYSQKYVNDSLDDHEGKRQRDAIENFHGVVKFEWAKELTLDEKEPQIGWSLVEPFKEHTTLHLKLADGSRVRVWVRATDIMGNVKSDSTVVTFDKTPPLISTQSGDDHKFEPNIEKSKYNYTSRVDFTAADAESGVHKIGFSIIVTSGNQKPRKTYEGFIPAAMSDNMNDPLCDIVENMCFIPKQTLYLDNCWFLVSKSDLDSSTASVEVTAYNQALLSRSTVFDVGAVNKLQGLEKYSGPENIRIESPTSSGFRVAWDLPERTSCYGRAEIVLVLLRKKANEEIRLQTFYAPGTAKFFDILGLDAVTEYLINFGMKMPNASSVQATGVSLQVKTPAPDAGGTGSSTGVIVGVTLSMLALIVIVVIIMVLLVRRGYIHPAQKAESVRRAVSRKVRKTVYGDLDGPRQGGSRSRNVAYDNRQSELYIYGGMDMGTPQIWHIHRDDVIFETLIKSGHFANIYKAKLKTGRGSGDVVVAKTLKERFTSEDELLMKAKINFAGTKLEKHPNVLTFIGAVVQDDAMGPFIILEYCEKTLRDYLLERKNNITMDLQENLFRFGLDIAKGMEYLAGKGIVHRRLAARNILVTCLNEVKIAGFGPQPSEENGGDAEKGKRERIPIKWVAPECMESTHDATEKSDVWSYAVVLWEIFSLGDTPYTGKGTDLPKRLKRGERLAKPEQCDDTWYATMKKCWSYEASKRPTFFDIRQELDNLFVAAPGDDYYFYKK